MVRPRDERVRQPPKRAKGIGVMIVSAALALASLLSLLIGVNAVGYLMGAGTEVRITGTKDSVDSEEGGEHGRGYYEEDGERIEVSLPYIEDGETITARKALIQWMFGKPIVISNKLEAREELEFFIGFLVLGFPGFFGLLGGWFLLTGRYDPQTGRPVVFAPSARRRLSRR